MRFITDENISPKVVSTLRQAGYGVVDVKETRRLGWSDQRILTWASSHGCVVITHDKDFAQLLKGPLASRHAGVILIRLSEPHPDRVVAIVLPVIAKLRSRRLRNTLVIIGDDSVEYLRG